MLPLLAGLVIAQGSAVAAPPHDFEAAWKTVSKAIESRYYARQKRKAEMDSLLAKYGPIASAAKSDEEFEANVNKMIDEFGDSHFDFFTPRQQGYFLMQDLLATFGQDKGQDMPNIGAWFKQSPDGYTVQMLLNDSPAAQAGIRKGDVISAADGKAFAPVESLRGKWAVKLSLKRNGKPVEIEVHPQNTSALSMFVNATKSSTKVFEQNGKKIGYFKVWTMGFAAFRDPLVDAMDGPLKDTDAMILDIRDGFGGRPEGFGDPFFPADKPIPWLTSKQTKQPKVRYDKPLVVLINEGSRSAKEVFSFAMRKNGRATLIGSNTAGHVLGTSPLRLNDWSIIEIPIVPVIVDGVDLERKGVAPDIAVEKEFDANGKDLYIERALRHLTAG